MQPVVVEAFWQRPTQAGLLETGQILADGALADLDAARDLALRHLQSEVQPQHVVDFSWRLSFRAPLHQKGYPVTLSSAVHFSTGRFQMIAISDFKRPTF